MDTQRLSLAKCRNLLPPELATLDDVAIIAMRDRLYMVAGLGVDIYEDFRKEASIQGVPTQWDVADFYAIGGVEIKVIPVEHDGSNQES